MLLLTSLLLFAAVCSDATPVTRTEVHTDSRRLEEFHAHLARQRRQLTPNSCPPGTWYDNRAACDSVNYNQFDQLGRRASGLLAAPMDQGSCGSCWAFASTGTFTDHRNLAAGQSTLDLSPQYMITCADSRFVGNGNGCCGSSLDYGPYMLQSSGATTASCVSYTLQRYRKLVFRNIVLYSEKLPICPIMCDNGMPFDLGSIRVGKYVELDNKEDIITAIDRGPVVAAMSATADFKDAYMNGCGVYCSSAEEMPNHAVEIVDYGTTDSGIDFYVVKNSYGTDWGEKGYFRIRRSDLKVGSSVVELVLSTSGIVKRNSSPNNETQFNPANVSVCKVENIRNPSDDEVIMIVANFTIEELNRRSLIRCPDNVTIAGPITLSSVMAATVQAVAGINYDVNMRVQVMGCCDIINANISAEVFQELGGNFTLTAYTYSSGMVVSMSLMLLLGAVVLALILPNY